MSIHPTAIIEDGATIADDAIIGPFCHIGPNVTLAEGVVLEAHVVVQGATMIGARTKVHSFSVLGGPPQHLGYQGQDTKLIIGADNTIREHVTMNIGTAEGRGETRVGEGGMFMTGCHIAHDCIIGDRVIFANNATLGGHVTIGDQAFLGGLCAIHQFCRVGYNAFVGGAAAAPTDLIPFGSATGNHANLSGLNIVGMKRRGFNRETIHAIRNAYKDIFHGPGTLQQGITLAEEKYGAFKEVMDIIGFIRADAKRPIMTPLR